MEYISFSKTSKAHGSVERVFEYRISNAFDLQARMEGERAMMMDAMVLANGLCIVVMPQGINIGDLSKIQRLSFTQTVQGEASEKKKKPKVLSKSAICSIVHDDGSTTYLHSPVGGQVLELNKRLEETPSSLLGSFEGYLAVIQPDDKIAKAIKAQN